MIVDGILNLFYSILSPIVDALPKGSLPAGVGDTWNGFAGYFWSVDALIPIAGPMQFLITVVITTVPAFLAYRVGIFLYNKVRGS